MQKDNFQSSAERTIGMLKTALGEQVGVLLKDRSIIEIMANPGGELWIDSVESGRQCVGEVAPENIERAICIVASALKTTCSRECPLLAGELPESGFRFQGLLPPVVEGPTFTIRKKASKVFTLSDYVESGIMSSEQAELIDAAVQGRKNILIAGGTGSGKTTLANAILNQVALTGDRLVSIEDTRELMCPADDYVALRTVDGRVSMRDLVRVTLRLRPDRIVIGEVRGAEALDLLKAWNTGHPGGCATVHADSAQKAVKRLESLIQEAGVPPDPILIAETINLVAFIERTPQGRRLSELAEVEGYENGRYVFRHSAN